MGSYYSDDPYAEDHIHLDITTCNTEEPQPHVKRPRDKAKSVDCKRPVIPTCKFISRTVLNFHQIVVKTYREYVNVLKHQVLSGETRNHEACPGGPVCF